MRGTGVVTLTANPDYETKSSYSFTVTASDAAGTSTPTTVTFAITNVDEVVPTITSGGTGTNKAENSGAGQTVYTITADANDGGTIASYAIGGDDAALLAVNAVTGVVTLTANPNYEAKNSYSFTVTASDAAGTSDPTTVTFAITNIDESVPTITSGSTGTDLAENSGAGQTVYTVTADANDGGTIASYAIGGDDADSMTFNTSTGVVKLTANPNYEAKSSYSFTVTASDAAGTSDPTTVTFAITNVDESVPTITSGETGTNKAENSGAGQTVYTITADANDGGTIASYAIGGDDASLLAVNASSGVVTLTANPNYEAKASYSFTVTASDAAGTSDPTTVTFAITNVDESVPTITSGETGTDLAENSGAGQTVYTVTADANDGGTIASYAIGGDDADSMTFNTESGVVKLTGDPDYETKSSYSFTVTASDAAGTSDPTTVTFAITNVDESVPTITSGATGTDLAENSGAGQTVYTVTADANDGGTIASYAIGGDDADSMTFNTSTGVVKLTGDPDYETKSSYSFTVTASDAAGTSDPTTVTFAITNVDESVPTITSGETGTDLAENSGAGQTVYTVTADANDGGTIQSYAIGGDDADSMTFNTETGVVKLTANPDYETKNSYSFTVTASDAAGTSDPTTVTFAITDVDDTAPSVNSVTAATADGSYTTDSSIDIQIIFNEVVTVTGTPTLTLETGDNDRTASYVSGGSGYIHVFRYTVQSGDDSSDLDYKSTTALGLNGGSIQDAAGNNANLTLPSPGASNSLADSKNIVIDAVAPTITSGETGTNKAENSGAGQTVYTITASDNVGATTFAIGGDDAGLLAVNAGTGVVTLTGDPNYEAKSSYSFTVTASDALSNTSAATTVTFAITNVDEVAPTDTSGATGTDLAENSGAGQTVYTVTADANDGGTIESYAIGGDDADSMTFNTSTGVVKLTANPDYETKSSYSFTVTASDAAGTSDPTTVTFAITNVDDAIPTITSGETGTNKAENSGAGQTVYTITADANDGGTIASYAIGGDDASLLAVNAGQELLH